MGREFTKINMNTLMFIAVLCAIFLVYGMLSLAHHLMLPSLDYYGMQLIFLEQELFSGTITITTMFIMMVIIVIMKEFVPQSMQVKAIINSVLFILLLAFLNVMILSVILTFYPGYKVIGTPM